MKTGKHWKRLIYFFVGLIAVYLGACFMLARTYLAPPRVIYERPAGVDEIVMADHTPVWVSPGLKRGGSKSKTVFIMAHGYQGCRASWSDVILPLTADGYEVAVPAMPAHDTNPDPTCGFGVKETSTVLETVKWARTRFAKPPKVVLVGISMGGAAVWMASDKDPSVSAVVTEGSFAVLDETTNRWFDRVLPFGHHLMAPVVLFAKWMSGVDPSSVRPIDAAAKWNGRPSLIIQAEKDQLMPHSYAERLAHAAGCPLWTVAGATHAQCKVVALSEYTQRLVQMAKLAEASIGHPK